MQGAVEHQVHAHLQRVAESEPGGLASLMGSLQAELRQIARRQRRRSHAGETFSTRALVNEAYLKFVSSAEEIGQMDHRHFLAVAAQAMRHILINHARDRVAAKRGGGALHVELDEALVADGDIAEANRLLELSDALERLEQVRPRLAQVVQLRFFAGLGEEEIGEVLGINRSTVQRDWLKARGWLYDKLGPDAGQ